MLSLQRPGVPRALASQRMMMSPPWQKLALGLRQLILVPGGRPGPWAWARPAAATVARVSVYFMAMRGWWACGEDDMRGLGEDSDW